ncbi:hypothetical protein BGX20_004875 [Mortierella sp. AD010]|nr:hypothetical protein BGX20_004875 [Mortierella sp. AD010]
MSLAFTRSVCSATDVYFYENLDRSGFGGVSRIDFIYTEFFKRDSGPVVYGGSYCSGNYRSWDAYTKWMGTFDTGPLDGKMNDNIRSWMVVDKVTANQEGYVP